MAWWNRLWRKKGRSTSVETQSRPSDTHPFNVLSNYVPMKRQELELYKTIREAVPIVDRAVDSIVRLVGAPVVKFDDDKLQAEWDAFAKDIKVNAKSKGLSAFIGNYLDVMIENGFACAEIVPNRQRNNVYALVSIAAKSVELKRTDNPLDLIVAQRQPQEPEPVALPFQDLVLFTPLNPEEDDPTGVSLLRSLPFVTQVLLRIFHSIGLNWERVGNLQFAVTYKPQKDEEGGLDEETIKSNLNLIKQGWAQAMAAKKAGGVKDFFGVGDVQVKVIGADGQILDSEVPGKQMLEHIVAKTGLPPYLLGLSWSTTERMSSEQADLLTSELENYREHLNPAVQQIANWWLRLTGKRGAYTVEWPDINLKDAVELARVDLIKAQAEEKRIKNAVTKRDQNIITQEDAAEELGYEKPAGPAPPRGDPTPPTREAGKKKDGFSPGKQFVTEEQRLTYWKELADPTAHIHEEKSVRDNDEIEALMDRFEAEMFGEVEKLEKGILRVIGLQQDGKSAKMLKDIAPGSHFYLTADQTREIQQLFEEFVSELLGDVQGLGDNERADYHAYYVNNMLMAFGLGAEDAWQWVKADIPEIAPADGPKTKPDLNTPYVRELINNGMQLVVTRAQEKYIRVMSIMAEHAAVGDNPNRWAASLYNSLHGELGGERWYWKRLARSESAMAIDRAADEEYEAEGVLYVEWVAAPDACVKYCKPLDNNIYTTRNAPRVVVDTHPHCRCRKRPRTARYAQESGRLVR